MTYGKIKCEKGTVTLRPSRKMSHKPLIVLKKGEEKTFEEFADYSCYAENISAISSLGVLSVKKEFKVATTEEIIAASSKKTELDEGVESEAEQRLIEKEKAEAEQKKAELAAKEAAEKEAAKQAAKKSESEQAKPENASQAKPESADQKAKPTKKKKSREQALKELHG